MNIMSNVQSERSVMWFGNTAVAIQLASSSNEDRICVIEHWMPFGEAPPLHVHHREDEAFCILSGVLRLRVGDRDIIAGAGETVVAPKGIPHAFQVESPEGARCLTITRGHDFETMIREMGRPATHGGLPPASAPTPDIIAALVAACQRNHIDILGPSLAA